MPGCLRDAAPDAWGRRVILNRKLGTAGRSADTAVLDELNYLLLSSSDRIGTLDFQASATEYVPREGGEAPLKDLLESADRTERGERLSPALARAIHHGTSIGGARPKAAIERKGRKWIAEFSSSSDVLPVVRAEFVAMRLAKQAGLSVAHVELVQASRKMCCWSNDSIESGAAAAGVGAPWCLR